MEKIPTGVLSSEAERYFGVLFEDISGKFSLLLEGFEGLDKKIDGVGTELLEFREDMSFKIKTLTERIDALEAKVVNLEIGMGRVEQVMTWMLKELRGMRIELGKKPAKIALQRIEKRVAELEREIVRE